MIDSLEETFRIGRERRRAGGDLAPQGGRRSRTTAARARRCRSSSARMQRQPIGLDCYPYIAALDHALGRAARDASTQASSSPGRSRIPKCAGMDLDDDREEWGVARTRRSSRLLPAGAIYFLMDEDDVQRILALRATP